MRSFNAVLRPERGSTARSACGSVSRAPGCSAERMTLAVADSRRDSELWLLRRLSATVEKWTGTVAWVLTLVATSLDHCGVLMARRGRKRRLEPEAEYWRRLASGVGSVEVFRQLGIGRKTGDRWRAENGGLQPDRLPEASRPGGYLSLSEHRRIASLRGRGLGDPGDGRPARAGTLDRQPGAARQQLPARLRPIRRRPGPPPRPRTRRTSQTFQAVHGPRAQGRRAPPKAVADSPMTPFRTPGPDRLLPVPAGMVPRHGFSGPARGPLASGPGMTVPPCRTDDLEGGVTGPGRRRWRR